MRSSRELVFVQLDHDNTQKIILVVHTFFFPREGQVLFNALDIDSKNEGWNIIRTS